MLDPLSITAAIATANTAINGIKRAFQVGKDIQGMSNDLSKWMSAASDIENAQKRAKNPSLLTKLTRRGSVEQEALNSIIVKKKLEEQERQIRDLLVIRYGIETYREMIQMRKDIKSKREKLVYAQRRRRKSILDFIAVLVGGFICFAIVYGFYELLMNFSR